MDEGPRVVAVPTERVEDSWLILQYPRNEPIRLDARILDRLLAIDASVALDLDGMIVTIPVLGGPDVARRIAEQLAPFTRSAPITQIGVYNYTKELVELAKRGRPENGALALFVGNTDIFCMHESLFAGDSFLCTVAHLEALAEHSANIEVGGSKLQAALALLVVAANRRRSHVAALGRRIEGYEQLFLGARRDV